MVATRFKDDTNALNATHVTDPNQIVEIIQKSLCWNVLQGGRESIRGSDVAFAEGPVANQTRLVSAAQSRALVGT